MAMAASGHASSAEPRWLTGCAVFLHVLGVMGWAGALPSLASGLLNDSHAARRRLALFSAFVPVPTVALALSGAVLTVVQLTPDLSRWTGPYVWILTAKALVLAFVAVAACYNRFTLTAPALTGNANAVRLLRRVIVGEIAAALLVFGLVSAWRFTPPPRAYAVVSTVSDFLHMHGDPVMANMTISGVVGSAIADIEVLYTGSEAIQPRSVELTLSSKKDPSVVIRRDAVLDGTSHWTSADLPLLSPEWDVIVSIRVSDFEVTTLEGTSILQTTDTIVKP
jgi:copper transport protein